MDAEGEGKESTVTEAGVDLGESLQDELCKLWDMSMNSVSRLADLRYFVYKCKSSTFFFFFFFLMDLKDFFSQKYVYYDFFFIIIESSLYKAKFFRRY